MNRFKLPKELNNLMVLILLINSAVIAFLMVVISSLTILIEHAYKPHVILAVLAIFLLSPVIYIDITYIIKILRKE